VTTLHDFEGVLGHPLDTFFGLSQFHGHGSCVKWPLVIDELVEFEK
jgi:hypothetical protein